MVDFKDVDFARSARSDRTDQRSSERTVLKPRSQTDRERVASTGNLSHRTEAENVSDNDGVIDRTVGSLVRRFQLINAALVGMLRRYEYSAAIFNFNIGEVDMPKRVVT